MVSLEEYIKVVKNHHPDITDQVIKIFDQGWDHIVIVINGKDTYRFPRGEDYKRHLPIEVAFINEFISQSPITIPKPSLHTDEKIGVYATYPFIEGVPFTTEIARTFTQEELHEIAEKMGKFLKAMHKFPIERAKKIGVIEPEPLKYWRNIYELRKKMFHYLSVTEQHWVKNIFNEFFLLINEKSFSPVVTHSDIYPDHIIVDPEKHVINGVIDVSDVSIGDPAYDFSFLDNYGKLFLDTVFNAYSLSPDKNFNKRRRFYKEHDVLNNLDHAIKIGDIKKIEEYKQLLNRIVNNSFNNLIDTAG